MESNGDQTKGARVLAAAHKMPLLSMFLRRLNPRQEEVIALLQTTTIFSELRRAELVELLHLLHERTFIPTENVFIEGETGFALYVIFKGEIQISTAEKSGKVRVATLGPGEVFGEVSFLDGSGRSATASVQSRAELIAFYRMELLDLLERRPVIAAKILMALSKQMSLRMRAMLQLIGA